MMEDEPAEVPEPAAEPADENPAEQPAPAPGKPAKPQPATAKDLRAYAKSNRMEIKELDPMSLVATFPGIHKTLKSLALNHWRRFPIAMPQEGRYLAATKIGVVEILDGKPLGSDDVVGKHLPIL